MEFAEQVSGSAFRSVLVVVRQHVGQHGGTLVV
jgi:hypothetical protein